MGDRKPKNQVKLALGRLVEFMERYEYIISTVYCEKTKQGKFIRFVECRTPLQQKTFFIHIPEKYSMLLDSKTVKTTFIRAASEDGSKDRQFTYIANVKGPLLECDLVAISGVNICAYKNSGLSYFYEIGDAEPESEKLKSPEPEKEESEVENLEKQTQKILSKVSPGESLPKPEDFSEEDFSEEESKTEESEESEKFSETPKEKIELVFQDPEGGSIEDVKEFLTPVRHSELQNSLEKIKRKVQCKTGAIKAIGIPATYENSPPPGLENSDIVLGIVYFLVDIGPFYRDVRASTLETKVIKVCKQIDDNIVDIRKTGFSYVKELVNTLMETGQMKLSLIEDSEKKLRTSLVRLTIVLREITALKDRTSKDPKKFGEELHEIERIYNQTRNVIYELNMELLQLRDSADELLSNYSDTIKELIEL